MHNSTLTILDVTYLPIGDLSGKPPLYQLLEERWRSLCRACRLRPLLWYNGAKFKQA